ncbi:arsenite methyltransferase [Nocardia sp. 2]|uniref:Arsenite methyltransferase n=1 Tax=Nocardia acididurans TaxID=2802282 RepID=A0ABS1MB07_9NOCA|nr:arsenite methyltransferase [Nocardia acididurans]MBL1076373.1 arsenite methyltransferase [Nocardia acididurans]
MTTEETREQVRAHYAAAARSVIAQSSNDPAAEQTASCCAPTDSAESCCSGPIELSDNVFGASLYGVDDREQLPADAVLASLGCGNPVMVADLRAGDTVLDLGSGGGIDVLLSARRVGPTGKAYGLDMTEEMLALAIANARKAEVTNIEFLKGTIESVPLPADTIDVIISNCVINLSTDKAAVFAESLRVLRPGGRFGVSDVVADDTLTPDQRAERGGYVACIAGALSFSEYREGLTTAGFTDVEITTTHDIGEGLHGAIIRATKPADG